MLPGHRRHTQRVVDVFNISYTKKNVNIKNRKNLINFILSYQIYQSILNEAVLVLFRQDQVF